MSDSELQTATYLAHLDDEGRSQLLSEHLLSVSELASGFSAKIGLGTPGALVGLLHDLGKYSNTFQQYLHLISKEQDTEAPRMERGSVDHSTAGAQTIWRSLASKGKVESIAAQICALCIASHHSGLIDCVDPDGTDKFSRRMLKADSESHYNEARSRAERLVIERSRKLLDDPDLVSCVQQIILKLCQNDQNETIRRYMIGLLARFLFSCLIDADRTDTADFTKPSSANLRQHGRYEGWDTLANRLEHSLEEFPCKNNVDELRRQVASRCLDASDRSKGVFTLTVPTGGGKTLASLRFALNHAARWKMDRVIYVIPYTSIIDQNADVVRKILEPEGSEFSSVVLEHHSNLTPVKQTWRSKVLTETWDAPVVFTTTVQLLESLFGAGTRSARRMHQLANAVLIFDEVQTLPVRCVHLFNNAMNFLVEECGSSVLLCTATQPLLHEVDKSKGAIRLRPGDAELMPDVRSLFTELKRVEVLYCRKPGGWTYAEAAGLAISEMQAYGSSLVVVNTKAAARSIFELCRAGAGSVPVFHLSTSMCPAHRKRTLRKICRLLKRKHPRPVICVSTQLIEAGVDIDFGAVIRSLAGLDSIAQAAGRCNRHGKRDMGRVRIINLADEFLHSLKDIQAGQEAAQRVLDEYVGSEGGQIIDLQNPEIIRRYFQYYFFSRAREMDYPVDSRRVERDDTLLNMLGENMMAVNECRMPPPFHLRQSFMTAADAFEAIEAPTQGVIVPYSKAGQDIIAELCSSFEIKKQFSLLKRAQQFSVNVFPNVMRTLQDAQALHEVQEGTGILYLDKRFYSEEFGLSDTVTGDMEMLHV
jgi:CRISPR-associated endonuclease/helicase Cas3